jgi:preprotein translocase subunit SecD
VNIKDPLNWTPSQDLQLKLAAAQCPKNGGPVPGQIDIPSQPLIACDSTGNRYLLSPALIEGRDLTGAKAQLPTTGTSWEVDLSFDGKATNQFTTLTEKLAGTSKQFAIVLDGSVVSAPTVESVIAGGQARITGNFSQQSATELANVLKYGALPLSFQLQGVQDVGPQLASNQLNAGILAGIIGLILVVGYCMLYYRALFVVIVASLGIAGVLTYACVLLLGHAYGFTLTLPGVAGLIVAVGITADSFIVYFERIRDEVRDGRTLRSAVEAGWRRARMTIIAADSVSFLAALVLFIFAIDVVKGFAFALGLTTLIDVFVVFFFTKPLVTLLARTRFFGRGHRLSGFDRRHLGIATARPSTRGGGA